MIDQKNNFVQSQVLASIWLEGDLYFLKSEKRIKPKMTQATVLPGREMPDNKMGAPMPKKKIDQQINAIQ